MVPQIVPKRFLHQPLLSLLVVSFCLIWPAVAHAQDTDDRLTIVTKEIRPFVFVTDDEVAGFSIDLWEAIAFDLGLTYEFVIVDSIEEQLNAVQSGEADVAIAGISITRAREETLDFSFPYFESGLGILTATEANTPFRSLAAAAFSPAILRLLAGLGLLILLASHLVWFLERGSEGFSRNYLRGIWDGVWWATATVTTVGYGDHVPRRGLGRIVGLFWMLAGVFILANFTANVTTELTVQRLQSSINGPQDLVGKRLVTVEGSTAAEWLADLGLPHQTVSDIGAATARLADGDVQAVVYDYPILLYHARTDESGRVQVAGGPFRQENYGIAFPSRSPLREEVNQALLQIIETGAFDELATRWFGALERS